MKIRIYRQTEQDFDRIEIEGATFETIVSRAAVEGLPCSGYDRSEAHTSELQSIMRISYAGHLRILPVLPHSSPPRRFADPPRPPGRPRWRHSPAQRRPLSAEVDDPSSPSAQLGRESP